MGYWQLFAVVAPIIFMIAIGSGLRHIRWLTQEADASLLKLVVNLLYPSLIFTTCASHPAAKDAAALTIAPLVGFLSILLGFIIAAPVARALVGGMDARARTFIFAAATYNYGYIPVPLMKEFFPEQLGMLFVFNLGVDVAIWTIGIALLSGGRGSEAWKRILNPSVIAMAGGVLANVTGFWPHVPSFVGSTLGILAQCTVPIAMLMIGATLIDEVRSGAGITEWKLGIAACLLRLALLPALFLGAAWILPLAPALKQVLIVQAAMPAAILPIVLAKHYNGDARLALWIVLSTTVLGLFLIPLWIGAGMHLLGFGLGRL
jgi:predicted permease